MTPLGHGLRGGTVALGFAAALHAQRPAPETASLDSLLNTRISSAAKYEQTIAQVAGAVTIVTSEEIEHYGYRTLAEVLAAARGFYLSDDRNYSYLGVRGFSRPTDYNNRVVLLIDGYLTNDGIWGQATIGGELGFDLAALERIEIIRGPSSALYGTGAMFGIVNLVTKDGEAARGLRMAGRGGSYGRRGGSLLFGRTFGRETKLMVSGSWDGADGQNLYFPEFDAPGTNRGLAVGVDGEDRWGFLANLSHRGLALQARVTSRHKSIPTAPYGVNFNDPGTWTTDRYAHVQAAHEAILDPSKRLRTRAYLGTYRYEGDYDTGGDPSDQEGARNEVVGGESTLQWDLSSANRLTAGVEIKRHFRAEYFYPRTGPRAYQLRVPYSTISAYLQDEYQITPRLAFLAGFRWDRYSHTGNAAAPRAAVIFAPSGSTTLKLLYGRAYRTATLVEGGTSFGSTQLNPDLEAERLWTSELIYQQRLGSSVLLTTSLFKTHVSDLIDPVEDDQGNISLENVGHARTEGLELGLDARLGSGFGAYASYAHQRASDHDRDERLTNSPSNLLKGGVSARVARTLRTALELRYESGRRTVQGTETDAFALANLNLLYLPRLESASPIVRHLNHLELSLKINNLTGTSYALPGGLEHLQSAIVQDGRNILLEARILF